MADIVNSNVIFGLLGGLGLFLYGMRAMSEGLQKVAGDQMRRILASLTNNRLIGAFVGISVTAIIQSSSAVSVMVVGFVNAGLLSLGQAIGVILGVNIGTTITAQLIAFNIARFALPAIGLGAGLALFSKNRRRGYWGEILLGFGLLFLGLTLMKQAFGPLRDSAEINQLLLMVGDYRLLGVLIGALLTVLIQSSTAMIGITLALATSGLIGFEASVALILGENIGTTITTNIAAIGTNIAARRTAFCHFLLNVIGVTYMLLFFPWFIQLVTSLTPGDADLVITTAYQAEQYGGMIGDKPFIARHIANTHTLFNFINALVFLPFVGLLAKLSTLFLRGQEDKNKLQVQFIDSRVLNTPPIALGQARREVDRMAETALEMLQNTNLFLENGALKTLAELERREKLIDFLQQEVTDFLVALSQKSVAARTTREITRLMHIVNDLERIGDHCQNLWELGHRRLMEKVPFSETGFNELAEISGKTEEFLTLVVQALAGRDATIGSQAIEYENIIDDLERTLRDNHIDRLNTGECSVKPGMIFIDLLHNFEKISDHTYNIADELVGEEE